MLPLTEGSLRLRADDEDSLTSEDSFFSATEVISWGIELGRARPSGPALGCVEVRLFSWVGTKLCLLEILKCQVRAGVPPVPRTLNHTQL